jgi:hypothetical protein
MVGIDARVGEKTESVEGHGIRSRRAAAIKFRSVLTDHQVLGEYTRNYSIWILFVENFIDNQNRSHTKQTLNGWDWII